MGAGQSLPESTERPTYWTMLCTMLNDVPTSEDVSSLTQRMMQEPEQWGNFALVREYVALRRASPQAEQLRTLDTTACSLVWTFVSMCLVPEEPQFERLYKEATLEFHRQHRLQPFAWFVTHLCLTILQRAAQQDLAEVISNMLQGESDEQLLAAQLAEPHQLNGTCTTVHFLDPHAQQFAFVHPVDNLLDVLTQLANWLQAHQQLVHAQGLEWETVALE
jgi:hypothetical protein